MTNSEWVGLKSQYSYVTMELLFAVVADRLGDRFWNLQDCINYKYRYWT